MYSERVSEELQTNLHFYSSIPKNIRKANFDKILEESPDLVNELENLHPALYREWRYYRGIQYRCDDFREDFKKFLEMYPKDFPSDQLIKLEGELLHEWRLKSLRYEDVYEEYLDYKDYLEYNEHQSWDSLIHYESKTKTELFKEFKTFWHLDVDENNEPSLEFPNMTAFNEIYNTVLHFEDSDEFYKFCENANYSSFDSYPIIEQYRIQQEFLEMVYKLYGNYINNFLQRKSCEY